MKEKIKWDDVTTSQGQTKLSALLTLETGLKMRVEAKRLETEAKELKKDADNFIESSLMELNLNSAEAKGVGTLALYMGTRTSFDTAKIETHLLKKGVSAAIISGALTAGKKVTSYCSVRFTAAKVV